MGGTAQSPKAQSAARGAIRHVLLVPVDDFSLLSLAAVMDPLRSANRALGEKAYRTTVATLSGAPVTASSGIVITADVALREAPAADLTLLFAGLEPMPERHGDVSAELRRRAVRGEALGGISTGPWLLGVSGLLDGVRCTIHWERRAAFADAAPQAIVTEAPYEIDRGRYTSSGGTASMDMMLAIIGSNDGPVIARQVANQFQHERIRSSADRQRPAHEPDLTGKPETVARLIKMMADNLETPLPAHVLARSVNLSSRQVERLFERYVNATPTSYYIKLRLMRARELLRQTDASVLEIALATGFASQSHFAQSYRTCFGVNPSDERRMGSNSAPRGALGR